MILFVDADLRLDMWERESKFLPVLIHPKNVIISFLIIEIDNFSILILTLSVADKDAGGVGRENTQGFSRGIIFSISFSQFYGKNIFPEF